jgi:signal transduction histidine kinase
MTKATSDMTKPSRPELSRHLSTEATPEDVLAMRDAPVSREFLVFLNHELRSPLQVIIGFSELLALGNLEETDRL